MKITKRHIVFILIALTVIIIIYYCFFGKKKAIQGGGNKISPAPSPENGYNAKSQSGLEPIPTYSNLKFQEGMAGIANSNPPPFPMMLVKVTDGPIELPTAYYLYDTKRPYKYIDIMPGGTFNATGVERITYVADNTVLSDDFLISNNGYALSYSQASKHFMKKK